MITPDKYNMIEEFVLQEYDGECTDIEFDELNELLSSDPELMDYYLEFVSLCAVLAPPVSVSITEEKSYDIECDQLTELCMELAEEELKAEPTETAYDRREMVCPVVSSSNTSAFRQKMYNFPYYSTLFLIAVMLLGISYVYTHPRHIPQDVATVADAYMVMWGKSETDFTKGARIFDDQKLHHLVRGVLKIQFDTGTQVVIEAPAEFAIEQNERIRLKRGKLSAYVPSQAIGFRVNTPSCSVIDLGTEFGIDVSVRGETDVHMFKGKASLVTASGGQNHQGQVLQAREAKKVNISGKVQDIQYQERDFVRNFVSTQAVLWNGQDLSLASIVSGGNGLTPPRENVGIDQSTGQMAVGTEERVGEGLAVGYTRVTSLDYVDGVFSPDGSKGPVTLNSAGDVYDKFGETDGRYYMAIGAYKIVKMYTKEGQKVVALNLEGYTSASSDNICIHANSGITFDLQKIREAMPFVDIKAFTSAYGIPHEIEDGEIEANFYVFVDGEPRMIKEGVSGLDAPGNVKISLDEKDRFLTLVCTQGKNNFGDWTLFVNPILELDESSSH